MSERYYGAMANSTQRDPPEPGGDFDGYGRQQFVGRSQGGGTMSTAPAPPLAPGLPAKDPPPVRRFLDISSAYRNRLTAGQSVCDFSVPVNAPTRLDPSTALDPVLLAFPFAANFTSGASTTTNIRLNASSTAVPNYFAGCILEVGGVFTTVVSYAADTQVAVVAPPLAAPPATGTLYTLRAQTPVYRGTVAGVTAAGVLTLDPGASSSSATYTNCYIFLPGSTPPRSYRWAPITDYDPVLRQATVGGVGFGGFQPLPGDAVEVLAFTRDNVVPLVYTAQEPVGQPPQSSLASSASLASSSSRASTKPPMFRLRLSDLILPNLPVSNGYHGRLADYSHVYVGLSNDQGATFSNVMLSNNPYAGQALWKVPMSQFSTNVPFLYFDGGDMEQVVRLKPDQNLRVTVWLPNGQVLAFQDQSPTFFFPGHGFPIDNNPFAQISLTVGITRV